MRPFLKKILPGDANNFDINPISLFLSNISAGKLTYTVS